MSKLFNDNRKTTRLQNWDYRWKGLYFVTVNTKFGENYFGEISNGKMYLNDIGREVEKQWLLTPSIRPDMNLYLDEFKVMPNHFHGIIGIGRNQFNLRSLSFLGLRDLSLLVSDPTSLRMVQFDGINSPNQNIFGPQRKNLGSIMRGFKSSVTSWCRNNSHLFGWHSRYHDVLINNDLVLNKIRKYIQNNPKNWERDRFNKKQNRNPK